jgi:GxxExxY protein
VIIEDLLFKEECYEIIGICMKIHTTLGKGFKEVVYKDAMEIEFKNSAISYEEKNNLIFNMKELSYPIGLTRISLFSILLFWK